MKFARVAATLITCSFLFFSARTSSSTDNTPDRIRRAVDNAVRPMMAKEHIPGMAVGITISGKSWIFNYGVASTETHKAVSDDTLFEIGSISKTFTATLTAWAQVQGQLSLGDKVEKFLPALRNTAFGNVSLLNLGTHTPGGLPLQVPDEVHNEDQLMQYFKSWRPSCAPGSCRTYSNPSIGTLGLITAKAMGQDFIPLIQQRLLPVLGMNSTFIAVPAAKMSDYAQGYTKDDKPIRMTNGVLFAEAYGIKSTAPDMLRWLDANMNELKLEAQLQRAITDTHTSYFKAGGMTQDLIWEQYAYPVELKTLEEGNSPAMIFKANPVMEIKPPMPPQQNVWINKTGSTNGFGAYVAFVPGKQLGIVILANKNFPIEQRVTLAYQIVEALLGAIAPRR